MKYYGRNDNDYTELVLKRAMAGSKQYWVLETASQIVGHCTKCFCGSYTRLPIKQSQYKRYGCPPHDF